MIRRDSNHRLQLGLGLQQLNISCFDVEFRTQGLSSDFDGKFDYAGVYNAVTPFFSYEWAPGSGPFDWIGQTRLIGAIPLPRTGFKERFIGAGVDTSSAAGRHIPDAFLGFGYSLEHPVSNWRIDVGAMLYSLVVEPLGHSDIETALSISLSKSW